MAGDFEVKQKEQQSFLEAHHIFPASSKVAIDLGAGHGLQSVSLAHLGFSVKAVDFNKQLLGELRNNSRDLPVEIIEDDIRSVTKYARFKPEIILCCGDTLTHLDDRSDILKFIRNCCGILSEGGKLILSFRDYSKELLGNDRFIPVKSDDNRILTCFIEYEPAFVNVTDLLYEKAKGGWQLKSSSYHKVRIFPAEILHGLEQSGMAVIFNETINGLITVIAEKR